MLLVDRLILFLLAIHWLFPRPLLLLLSMLLLIVTSFNAFTTVGVAEQLLLKEAFAKVFCEEDTIDDAIEDDSSCCCCCCGCCCFCCDVDLASEVLYLRFLPILLTVVMLPLEDTVKRGSSLFTIFLNS